MSGLKRRPNLRGKLKVYFASKLHHASRWRKLRDTWTDLEVTSTWIDSVNLEREQRLGPSAFAAIWESNLQAIARSDVLVYYEQLNEEMRGALVEVGYALANDVWVLAVGANGTWQHAKGITSVEDNMEMMAWLANKLGKVRTGDSND